MATLIESPTKPLTLQAVAAVSRTLSEDLQKLIFRTEGFTVADYFALDGNYPVEYVEGRLQILPIPDALHQSIVEWFIIFLRSWMTRDPDARTRSSPFRIMLDAARYREPDISVMLGRHKHRRHSTHWEGADFVIEVISQSNRDHDLNTKRIDYAAAGIAEYWIIDPDDKSVCQLILRDGVYIDTTIARPGDTLCSAVLEGFRIDVAQMFREAEAAA